MAPMSIRSVIAWALFAGVAAGCSSAPSPSSFKTTWTNPVASPVRMTDRKVVVIALNVPSSVGMGVEAAVADELRSLGALAVGSYQVLPRDATVDAAKVKLSDGGFDAAFVIRLVDNEKELWVQPGVYSPGHAYQTYWEWGGGWGNAVSSEMPVEKTVYVETLVYSVRRDQLAWSGLSVTSEPEYVGTFCRELVRRAVAAMRRTGWLI